MQFLRCLCMLLMMVMGVSGLLEGQLNLASLVKPIQCGANEQYTTCGSACPATCSDLQYPLPKPPKICILICKSGCFCKQGFYRAADGKCVPPEQCCGNNERFKECGTDCVETCTEKPTVCTQRCVLGCFCGCSDYVRQNNSTGSPCVHRDDCPKSCQDDEA